MFLILATDLRGGIAKNGEIPWHYPEDMKFFKNTTISSGNNAVIMGKNTFFSIPEQYRPLICRKNVVLSKKIDKIPNLPSVSICKSLNEALGLCKGMSEIFVIGGKKVYEEAFSHSDLQRIYLTTIKKDYNCDLFVQFDNLLCDFTKHVIYKREEFDIDLYIKRRK